MPFGVLLVIGLYRQRAGSALGEPTGYLVILMVLTAMALSWLFRRLPGLQEHGCFDKIPERRQPPTRA